MRRFVAYLAAVATSRVEADETAEIVWATNAAGTPPTHGRPARVDPERCEDFIADTWRRVLLHGSANIASQADRPRDLGYVGAHSRRIFATCS